jgi:hypothetical protein
MPRGGGVSFRGGQGITIRPPDPGPGYLVFDDFNRADGPVGSTEAGQPWYLQYDAAETGIVANQFYTAGAYAIVQTGAQDVDITVDVPSYSSGATVIARAIWNEGSQNIAATILFEVEPTGWTLKVHDTPNTTGSAVFASGGTLRLVIVGLLVRAFINEVEVASVTSLSPFTPTVTFAGVGDVNVGPNYYDNFTVTAP